MIFWPIFSSSDISATICWVEEASGTSPVVAVASVERPEAATGEPLSEAEAESPRELRTKKAPPPARASTTSKPNQRNGLFSHFLLPRDLRERREDLLLEWFLSTRVVLLSESSCSPKSPPSNSKLCRI